MFGRMVAIYDRHPSLFGTSDLFMIMSIVCISIEMHYTKNGGRFFRWKETAIDFRAKNHTLVTLIDFQKSKVKPTSKVL